MKLPEPIGRPFTVLISDIEKGEIKIPQFQREFVWDIKKSAKLMDSIVKGYLRRSSFSGHKTLSAPFSFDF